MRTPDMRKVLAILMAVLLVMGSAATIAFAADEYYEEELGIRKESLYDEKKVEPSEGKYGTASPGASKRFQRAFENSPPLIPHDLTGMLPVAETNNMCVNCHMPKVARSAPRCARRERR